MAKLFFMGFYPFMIINYSQTPLYFSSNNGYYRAENGNNIGTFTKMFRADLDWERFTDYFVKHFRDKDNVQILQFASSDGSEAYSQIITLLENYQDKNINKFLPIEAYDIDTNVYNIAKSGMINISDNEKLKFMVRDIEFDKYFKKLSDKKIKIENDTLENSVTYEVSPLLRSKVNFHQGDMFDAIQKYKDNSNTILLCRNILSYFTDREIDKFLTTVSYKLKSGSLFVIGEIDNSRVDSEIQRYGFERVLPYVYRKN